MHQLNVAKSFKFNIEKGLSVFDVLLKNICYLLFIYFLDESLLGWRFHDLTHLDARTKHLLSTWAVGASSGTFVARHHHEDDAADESDEQQSGHNGNDDGYQLEIGLETRR